MPEVTEAQVIWGAALMLQRRYGAKAGAKVAERVADLATIGDELGCTVWRDIAGKLDQLTENGVRH